VFGTPAGAHPRRVLGMLGPGYIVAVGYMDPGNWTTDLAAGARYGLALLFVVLAASAAAAFLQALVVRLTVATGKDLAQLIRERFPRPIALVLWAVAELAMVATDLAELLGSAVALKLLLGLSIAAGVAVSAALSFAILALPSGPGRMPERVIGALVLVIVLCLVLELSLARTDGLAILSGLAPSSEMVRDPGMLYLSLGILGATIMPHNLYLHAGLTRGRLREMDATDRRQAARFLSLDSAFALTFAGLVNIAILVLAADAFHHAGAADVGLEQAYRLLDPALGSGLASLIFATALLASGQSSTATGTMAGQIVTEGFLDIRVPPALKALITRGAALVPALLVTLLAGQHAVDGLVILSQVILGLALPFVLMPMLLLLGDRRLMGSRALGPATRWLASALVVALSLMNGWLVGVNLA